MHILWNQIDYPQWDKAHEALEAALQQDWAYGTSLKALGIECHRAEVILKGETVALAQFICRRYGLIVGVALCTRGPLWLKPMHAEDKRRIYRELKRSLPMKKPRDGPGRSSRSTSVRLPPTGAVCAMPAARRAARSTAPRS